jgi:hypothetical protein
MNIRKSEGENMTVNSITASTTFILDNYDDFDAHAYVKPNKIEIGFKVLTIETIIHELNEIELSFLFQELGYNDNARIWNKQRKGKHVQTKYQYVTHIISPYGELSLIDPCASDYGKELKNEEYLIGV